MSRPSRDYAAAVPPRRFEGFDPSIPMAGFYRFRLRGGTVRGGVRIWHGPPYDPVTGEELDRSWRWQAEMDGQYIEIDDVWPQCAGEPISEDAYRELVARRIWAQQNAPRSSYADRTRKIDLLSTHHPLPF